MKENDYVIVHVSEAGRSAILTSGTITSVNNDGKTVVIDSGLEVKISSCRPLTDVEEHIRKEHGEGSLVKYLAELQKINKLANLLLKRKKFINESWFATCPEYVEFLDNGLNLCNRMMKACEDHFNEHIKLAIEYGHFLIGRKVNVYDDAGVVIKTGIVTHMDEYYFQVSHGARAYALDETLVEIIG